MSWYDQNSIFQLERKLQELFDGTTVRVQPSQTTGGLCPVQVRTPPRQSGSVFWPNLEQYWTEPQAKNRPARGLPGQVANTISELCGHYVNTMLIKLSNWLDQSIETTRK